MKELFAALSKAQAMMGKASKDSTNPAFRSKYADLESCVDAVRPALEANNLAFIQVSHDAEKAACIETIIIHASGDQISCGKVSVPVSKADAHGFGSALSYARRYSLSAAFGLTTADDDGQAAVKAAPVAQNKPAMPAGQGQPTSGAREAVSPERLGDLKSIAADLHALVFDENDFAIYEVTEALKDGDEKVALWTFLDSSDRAYIKKVCARLRAEDQKKVSA